PKTLETLAKKIADTTAALDKRLAPYSGPWEESLEFLRPRSDAPLTKYVNLYIGTGVNGDSGFSGNLSPSAQLPFGWVNFGPSMNRSGFNGSGGYLYSSTTIPYFSIKHLNGPGCTNHGEVAMLPNNTASTISASSGPSFDRANEFAQPGYYKVKFNGSNITTELTATQRTGMVRLTYDNKDKAFLHFDARINSQNRAGVPANMVDLTVDPAGKSLSGKTVVSAFCAPWGGGWNQPVYFYAAFDKPLKPAADTVNVVTPNKTIALQFDLGDADKTVLVKIGTSSVSVANAKLNVLGDAQFKGENPGWSFDDIRKLADDTWNKRLNTVQIDLAKNDPAKLTDNQKKKIIQFYSSLYRVFGGPTVYSDVNGEYRSFRQAKIRDASGQEVWPPYDDESNGKKVLNTPIPERETAKVSDYTYKKADGTTGGYKTHYSGFSTWDTYRTQAPFLALVAPDEASDMMQSLVAIAKQCGNFPHFADGSDDAWAMSGHNSITIVSGSYAFGAKNFDLASAAKFFKEATFDPNSACNNKRSYNTGSWTTEAQVKHYFTNGYFSDAAVSTVDSSIHDMSAAAFLKSIPAAALADGGVTPADISALFARASNWTNVFDDASKTIKDRAAVTVDAAGVAMKGPFKEGIYFHEATEPNYFWSFGHAWSDLINKLGTDRSTAKLAAMTRLNTLFSLTPDLSGPEPTAKQFNGGERSINYYVGNEMAFSAPWAYNWAGSPKHAQYVLKTILDKNFSNDPGGLPGNDDVGALTSWYVFATLGIYPIIPSQPGFAISTPQFDGISFWMPNGKKLRFSTGGKSALLDDVRFIQDMKLNGATYQGTWLPLDKIKDGGRLAYTLSKTPTGWGEDEALTPPSGPAGDYSKPTANPLPGVQIVQ
ncbi:alpha-1,2-mannosidase, putative, partial [Phyllobacterium sp. YR620]|uniref:glycoside hydrolase domain-containing protein n=1 Tax=Phyllobacterium sp. YR620 TaxID=1881066 RepID=UPI00087EFCB1